MTNNKRVINKLSDGMLSANPSDPQALKELHTLFREVVQWAKEESKPELAMAAEETAKIIEKMIHQTDSHDKVYTEITGRLEILKFFLSTFQ